VARGVRDFRTAAAGHHLANAAATRFNSSLTLSQVALNEPLGPEVFRVEIPPSADGSTLDELRHARPGVAKIKPSLRVLGARDRRLSRSATIFQSIALHEPDDPGGARTFR